MLKRILLTAATMVFMVASICAQTGSVVNVNTKQKVVMLKIDGKNHKVDASTIKILDADGRATTIASLSKGDKVNVVIENGDVKSIQKTK